MRKICIFNGFEPDETIEILLSGDTPTAICKSMGLISEVQTLCNVRNNVPLVQKETKETYNLMDVPKEQGSNSPKEVI